MTPIPSHVWDKLKAFLADRRSGEITLRVVEGMITSASFDGETIPGDVRLRAVVRGIAFEALREAGVPVPEPAGARKA